MFAQDARIFLADLGSPASWTPSTGGATITGPMLFDQPAQIIDGSQVHSNEFSVTFETAAWPGLTRDEVLVIGGDGGGARYKLQTKPLAMDDGVMSSAGLSKVRS